MNKKGFTLVELLGVIVILSIIMLIAIPNVTAVLDRTKRDSYIADCKKMVSLVQYQLRHDDIQKPEVGDEKYFLLEDLDGADEIEHDSDGNSYDKEESFVVVKNEDGFLNYYVQLVAKNKKESNHYHGIKMVNVEDLDGDDRYQYYKNDIIINHETT